MRFIAWKGYILNLEHVAVINPVEKDVQNAYTEKWRCSIEGPGGRIIICMKFDTEQEAIDARTLLVDQLVISSTTNPVRVLEKGIRSII